MEVSNYIKNVLDDIKTCSPGQIDPANRREVIAESVTDEGEGVDILMVKPALAYMDIICDVRENTTLPLAVYNVSGEYSMLKMAAKAGEILKCS